MAKPQRGLPDSFTLDLPSEKPVEIGDFLDEVPLSIPRARAVPPPTEHAEIRPNSYQSKHQPFRPEIVGEREQVLQKQVVRQTNYPAKSAQGIRYQLNLTPSTKSMLEELVDHVSQYGPEASTKVSEVFQGIVTLLYNAKDELDLSDLPKRGAWGSVTAKNFPVALSQTFEKAITQAARKRGAI